MSRSADDGPIVTGRPKLSLSDAEREVLAALLAELLVEAIGRAAPAEGGGMTRAGAA